MDTGWLRGVIDAPGPYVSVHMDITRNDFTAAQELRARWSSLRSDLLDQGAEPQLVETVGDLLLSPTGLGGPQGRSVVANTGGVLMDQVLSTPPSRNEAVAGPLPHLLPTLRGLSGSVPHAVVEIDRTGADIAVVGQASDKVTTEQVEGEHDVIHKVSGAGGWSHRRMQMRAEDSWERNATTVAERLDALVAEHRPQLVLLTGDDDSRSYVHDHASGRVKEVLVNVDGSGRADGVHAEAFQQSVEEVLSRHRFTAMAELVAQFEQGVGRHDGATGDLFSVVQALQTGSVGTLLLEEDLSGLPQLWAGEDPLHLGMTEDDVRALGSQTAVAAPADCVLVRAAAGQRAEVVPLTGVRVLDAGVGALLRFETRPPSHDGDAQQPGE